MKITINNPAYPDLLKSIDNPPKQLYCRGNAGLLAKTCVSVVGTRKSTEYGEYLTQKIIAEIAHLDVVIVSGLAHGIDTIAHRAALKNGLATIAVLACGINPIYPASNNYLADEIAKKGLIISENPENTEMRKYYFPLRNRIISGLSTITLVVEAPEKSGALITARDALEQGRELVTIPADVDRHSCWGNLKLLQDGAAYPISCGQDIVGILQKQPALFKKDDKPLYKLSPSETLIIGHMSPFRAVSIEELSQKSARPIQEILVSVSMLEMYGLVKNTNVGYLSISPH